jgi:type I restriction enzyme R subunit
LTNSESKLFEVLSGLKKEIDAKLLQNSQVLENESYVERMMMRLVIDQFNNKHHLQLDAEASERVNSMIVKEYMNEFLGRAA